MVAKTPLFRSIARALQSDIQNGAYKVGSRLPTEAQLADRFGVNRHTVRHALKALAEAGVVRSRRGSGTTVIARPVDYHLGARVRFRQNLLAEGAAPDFKLLSLEVQAATEDDTRILRSPLGADICVSETLSFIDGVPSGLARKRFPEHRLPGLAEALRTEGGVTAALKAVGVEDYLRATTRLSARLATAAQAVHLKVDEGAPLLHASSVNIDTEGQPVEYGESWFVSDRLTMVIDHLEDD